MSERTLPEGVRVRTDLAWRVAKGANELFEVTVAADSDQRGDLLVTVPKGVTVSAVRAGSGDGDCEVHGEGSGNAVREGDGAGDAIREGSGTGDAVRSGRGDGDAVRGAGGDGMAARMGSGDGDAVCAGEGHATRVGSGAGIEIDAYGSRCGLEQAFDDERTFAPA